MQGTGKSVLGTDSKCRVEASECGILAAIVGNRQSECGILATNVGNGQPEWGYMQASIG